MPWPNKPLVVIKVDAMPIGQERGHQWCSACQEPEACIQDVAITVDLDIKDVLRVMHCHHCGCNCILGRLNVEDALVPPNDD